MSIKFIDEEHKKAYYDQLSRCHIKPDDAERKALIYCLTISENIRRNINSVYDPEGGIAGVVSLNFCHQGWPTSSDLKCIRLGFNLFNGRAPISTIYDDNDAIINEYQHNTPVEIFSDAQYRDYFMQALRIRFEEDF